MGWRGGWGRAAGRRDAAARFARKKEDFVGWVIAASKIHGVYLDGCFEGGGCHCGMSIEPIVKDDGRFAEWAGWLRQEAAER